MLRGKLCLQENVEMLDALLSPASHWPSYRINCCLLDTALQCHWYIAIYSMPLFPLLFLKFFGLCCKAHKRKCVMNQSPCPGLSKGKQMLWGWPSWQDGMVTTGSAQGLHSSGRVCYQKTTRSGFIFPSKSAGSTPSGARHPIAGPHTNCCGLSGLQQLATKQAIS